MTTLSKRVDDAIGDLLSVPGGSWHVISAEAIGVYELIGKDAADYVLGIKVTIRHEQGMEVTGSGSTFGQALDEAIQNVLVVQRDGES